MVRRGPRSARGRRLSVAALALPVLALPVLGAFVGCDVSGDGRHRSGSPREISTDGTVPVLEGRSGDLLAILAPAGLGDASDDWYRERLIALAPSDDAPRTMMRVFLFHLGGENAAPISLADAAVAVTTASGEIENVSLPSQDVSAARGSVAALRALESYEGVALPPGKMLDVFVTFPGPLDASDVDGGSMNTDEIAVELSRTELSRTELHALLETPGRKALLAVVPSGAGESERP